MKVNTLRGTVIVATVTLLVGAGAGWGLATLQAHRDIRSLALAHALAETNLCAGGLKLERAQKSDRVVLLLEQQLESSITYASLLMDEGALLYPGTPNLREGARRAVEYYESQGEDGKRERAQALVARLEAAR